MLTLLTLSSLMTVPYGGRLNMKEEDVTKAIIKKLVSAGWEIICYDFPQSGTGRVLHPNDRDSKTLGAIIPDIVAIKAGIVLDFENKDRFVLSDFEKIDNLRNSEDYSKSWELLLSGCQYSQIFYGVGMPMSDANYSKAEENRDMVDFIVYLNEDGSLSTTGLDIF